MNLSSGRSKIPYYSLAFLAALSCAFVAPAPQGQAQMIDDPTMQGPVWVPPGQAAAQQAGIQAQMEENERMRREEELRIKLQVHDQYQIMKERGLSRPGTMPVMREYRTRRRGQPANSQYNYNYYYRRAAAMQKPKVKTADPSQKKPLPTADATANAKRPDEQSEKAAALKVQNPSTPSAPTSTVPTAASNQDKPPAISPGASGNSDSNLKSTSKPNN